MSEFERLRFRIGAYRPETMPMGRLAAYLEQLALLLGEETHVHLIDIEEGSVAPVVLVNREAATRVRQRVTNVRISGGPSEARHAYGRLNKLLAEDNGTGALEAADGAEIISFPGAGMLANNVVASILEHGNIDGKLIRVGGKDEPISLILEAADGKTVSRVETSIALAKAIAPHLHEVVRLHGRGRWKRMKDGQWELARFVVESFETLGGMSLPDAVAHLRATRVKWPSDAVENILADREDVEANG